MINRGQRIGLVKVYKRGQKKGRFMNEFDLDYIIIKLKKKSPRHRDEEKS